MILVFFSYTLPPSSGHTLYYIRLHTHTHTHTHTDIPIHNLIRSQLCLITLSPPQLFPTFSDYTLYFQAFLSLVFCQIVTVPTSVLVVSCLVLAHNRQP